jgi:cellulose synthase/poly-beta-1,6-N-acetylglucosamine synthase-like glycosyltransferase
MAVLKDLVRRCGESPCPPEVLVLTDANVEFEPDTLRRLVAPLADPRVGGVCGRLVFHESGHGKTDEPQYWELETWLKIKESALDSCLGANGAVYAIRRELFWREVPANTIIDDFVIGMKVRESGLRMIYEPEARAHEELPATVESEWRRRARIGAGAFQSLALCWRCLLPRQGWFAWSFFSHKVLRWFTPHLLLAVVLVSVWGALSGSSLARFTLIGCGAFGACALVGWITSVTGHPIRLLRAFYYFLAMQAALMAGFVRFCRGNLGGAWTRTARG